MNYPEIMNALYLLRIYKTKKSYSNATLATDLTAFGWNWNEALLASLFAGRVKLDKSKSEFIKLYLLDRYSNETLV